MDDLDAIAEVFSKDDLTRIMSRSGNGKNALEVFTGVSMSLKSHPPLERNAFFMTNAAKTTNREGAVRAQAKSPVKTGSINGARMKATDDGSMTSSSEKYEPLILDPVDELGNIITKTLRTK
jgi:hypothetical protein